MDALSAAKATAPAVANLASYFMLDMATYAKGDELGFEGLDFYVCGRGGALGDVPGDVVSAVVRVLEPATVVDAWEKGRQVMSPSEAATHFADVGHAWAESHLTEDVDLGRTAAAARHRAHRRPLVGRSPASRPGGSSPSRTRPARPPSSSTG